MTLKELRKHAKLTQVQVSSQLKVTQVAISQWEQGFCSPQMIKLQQLAKLYDVSTDDIIAACEQSRIQRQVSA